MMEEKLCPLFSLKEVLSEDEAVKMGRKDPAEEVEKFVSANTQELGKDKWLCPLSGKKFKVSACKAKNWGLYNTKRCDFVQISKDLKCLYKLSIVLSTYQKT